MEPKVVYKDENFLVLNKPSGLLVHGFGGSKEPTVVDWLLENFPEVKGVGDDPVIRPGIVHRLDKDTSGVMAIARHQAAFDYLKKLFQKHEVRKTYLALAWGRVEEKSGTISKPIGLISGGVKRSVKAKKMKMVKEAITSYKVIKFLRLNGEEFSLLEVTPKTGRTHQIRVHLASIGHPVVGDKLYGKRQPRRQGVGTPKPTLSGGSPTEASAAGASEITKLPERQFLHAEAIEFTLPNGTRLKVSAELPEDLQKLIS